MTHVIHKTFLDLTEDEFKTYTTELIDSYSTSSARKHSVSFLQMVNSKDAVSLRAERTALDLKRIEQRKKQRVLESLLEDHSFDFAKQPTLFQTQAAPSNTELAALLAQDNTEIFIRDRQHVGDLVITGNDVTLDGLSNKGSSRSDDLVNTATVLGSLLINGDNCTAVEVVVIEEHGLAGGAGSAILEWANAKEVDASKVVCFGVKDAFLTGCGSQEEARCLLKLDADSIISSVQEYF